MPIIHDVEQGSPEWASLRAGIPTASEFGRLVTGTGAPSKSLDGYARELAAEVFAGKPLTSFDGNAWMDRGRLLEEEAVKLYEFTNDATVQKVGFITNDANTAGCSPDGLIGDDSGLEIKCLKAESHLEVVTYHNKHGRCPPKYTPQVQGCLYITGRKTWTQMFHHPDLPPLIVVCEPDPTWQALLANQIARLIKVRDETLAIMRKEQSHIPDSRGLTPLDAG